MKKLDRIVNDYMRRPFFDMDLLVEMVRKFYYNFSVERLRDRIGIDEKMRNVEGKDVYHMDVFDDNLNEIYSNLNKHIPDIFNKFVGFKINNISTKFYIPIPCYVAAWYKDFTPDDIAEAFQDMGVGENKNIFVECLKINKNIRRKNTKLFIGLL
jgi:hypothetical protein